MLGSQSMKALVWSHSPQWAITTVSALEEKQRRGGIRGTERRAWARCALPFSAAHRQPVRGVRDTERRTERARERECESERERGGGELLLLVTENGNSEHIQSGLQLMRQGREERRLRVLTSTVDARCCWCGLSRLCRRRFSRMPCPPPRLIRCPLSSPCRCRCCCCCGCVPADAERRLAVRVRRRPRTRLRSLRQRQFFGR